MQSDATELAFRIREVRCAFAVDVWTGDLTISVTCVRAFIRSLFLTEVGNAGFILAFAARMSLASIISVRISARKVLKK